MEQGPPPLFNQGVSARSRLAFFAFLAAVLIIVDAKVRSLETIRTAEGNLRAQLKRYAEEHGVEI